MQVALASRRVAPAHVVDANSSLFLNLNELVPSDLVLREGRIAFKHSRDTPCVLHSNGHKGILSYLAPHLRRGAIAWAVTPSSTGRDAHARREQATWQSGAWRRFQLQVEERR